MSGGSKPMTVAAVLRRMIVAASLLGSPPLAAAPAQSGFSTPDDAVGALVDAMQRHDPAALARILGAGSEKLVRSGDPVKDREEAQRFLDAYGAAHKLSAVGPDRMVLQVGTDDWPLPVPLVRRNGTWRFDATAGAMEIVNRRIGRNELSAIGFSLAYADAQRAYFDLFKRATGTGVYAQFLVSHAGDYDGLYWPAAPGIPDSPLEPVIERAVTEEGYPGHLEQGKQIPYQGYLYRILKAQGADAPGGARSFVEDGRMTGGFGLIAWPAIYGASGIMTFITDQDGIVFQADLGPDTQARAKAIQNFNPGLEWARVEITEP